MGTKEIAFLLLALFNVASSNTGNGTQRFQADKFLDMLSRSFDPNVAYTDLMEALKKRVKTNNGSTGGLPGDTEPSLMVDSLPQCPPAPTKPGATVTYTSDSRVVGSRAFYQCDAGYEGRSLFIQCNNGGVWATPTAWDGCKPVDCGVPPPSVQHAESSYTTTTFGSFVTYTCQAGYKPDKPFANVTCLDTGYWGTPSFTCQKFDLQQLHLPSLQNAFNKNLGVQQLSLLQHLASVLINARQVKAKAVKPKQPFVPIHLSRPRPLSNPINLPKDMNQLLFPPKGGIFLRDPLMAALLKNMQSLPGFPGMPQALQTPPTTTTTQKPKLANGMPLGFQLPSHLQSLLPNGLSSTHGMKPQDLMTLASMGLGSSSAAAAPRDISQLLGSMNPMSIFGPAMGLGMPGAGASATNPTGPGGVPLEPEKVAEQREEMMLRAMMASAMKNMMPQAQQAGNGTAQARPSSNPAMEMMTLMALQSGLSGGGAGASGGSGGMDPMAMMLGGMNPGMLGLGGGAGGSGGLFGSLFGGA